MAAKSILGSFDIISNSNTNGVMEMEIVMVPVLEILMEIRL